MREGSRESAGLALPREIGPGVYFLEVGRGVMAANVYFVRSGTAWALIDAGSRGCAGQIVKAAQALFGRATGPAAILLTHDHPDHAGSALDLALLWDLPVWVHAGEMVMVHGDIATFCQYASPLDRWLVLPMLRMMGSRRSEQMVAASSFAEVARPLEPDAPLPGLPDWELVPSPGHTPGHVAFFRPRDRVLIAGDGLVTLRLNSPLTLVVRKQAVGGPPWYATWNWPLAKESARALAALEPRVLGGGHGIPMTGPDTAAKMRAFAESY